MKQLLHTIIVLIVFSTILVGQDSTMYNSKLKLKANMVAGTTHAKATHNGIPFGGGDALGIEAGVEYPCRRVGIPIE